MAKSFEDFTNLYQLSKTLRFEAKPVGATLIKLTEDSEEGSRYRDFLKRDQDRAVSYGKVKKLIDEYHKAYIDRTLTYPIDNTEDKFFAHFSQNIKDYFNVYRDKDKRRSMEQTLRTMISEKFASTAEFKRLFGKELISTDLEEFIRREPSRLNGLSVSEALELVEKFRKFNTYFCGFYENRKNMYTPEEKSTGIAFRLINVNHPKFIDNFDAFNAIASNPEMEEDLSQIQSDFKDELNGDGIGQVFSLDYYCKLLTQKRIDVYNAIIGGKVTQDQKVKIKGLNEYVNLYNQRHDQRLPKLKPLYKQILSDRNVISWLPEHFNNDSEVLEAINGCYEHLSQNSLKGLPSLMCSIKEFDDNGLFVNRDSLTDVSQMMFGDRWYITKAIKDEMRRSVPRKRNESDEDFDNRINGLYNKADNFSIKDIDDSVKRQGNALDEAISIKDYFASLGSTGQTPDIFKQIKEAYSEFKPLLDSSVSGVSKLAQNVEAVSKIKCLLDTLKSLQRFVKPLLGDDGEKGKDERFYGELSLLWDDLDTVTPLYNMVRNYMTRKPYSEDKIKINFDNVQFLGGWDENKEKDHSSIILRRDGKYYLAIMGRGIDKIGDNVPADGHCYEKMIYKTFDITKQLPKCTTQTKDVKEKMRQGAKSVILSDKKKWIKPLEISRGIWELNNYVWDSATGAFVEKKNEDKRPKKFQKEYLNKTNDVVGYEQAKDEWIEFTKRFLSSYKSTAFYRISYKDSYESVAELYKQLDLVLYNISFSKVAASKIDSLVDEGRLYLFQIYNKDFSEYSKGTPSMHTLYWKALFDERNLKDFVYKLNGEAELFFREKSIEPIVTHRAGQAIMNKNLDNGKKSSLFDYDLIKNRRFSTDKFLFHVPITMNYRNAGEENINLSVREYLKASKDSCVIGIDRGERHLLYLVVIDQSGRIIEQHSLNDIINEYNGKTYKTDYHSLLDRREKERQQARLSWKSIESIKELKEGYLSQVVHKISQLMVKYQAIVVLEDLNVGFIRGRQKVEKQIYQKFEKMLIDKLNYLVDKKADNNKPGGLMKAYQLTNKFESFQKLGKQTGFVFYIPAWNTSKIDPVTGFVNLFDTDYQNEENARSFFGKFDQIRYDENNRWFEFTFDYADFSNRAEGTRTKWNICTKGERIHSFRDNGKWNHRIIDLTEELMSLLDEYGIDVNSDIKQQISQMKGKDFFIRLMQILKLTLQMRNSISGEETDYILSPVPDTNGCFYDSRNCGEDLPKNADANGAFNIARKGLMLIRQIKQTEDENLSTMQFEVSNKSWLNFAQSKPYKDE